MFLKNLKRPICKFDFYKKIGVKNFYLGWVTYFSTIFKVCLSSNLFFANQYDEYTGFSECRWAIYKHTKMSYFLNL